MTSVRSALSAIALVVALIGASIVPAYSSQASTKCGPPAAQAAHDCCKAPILTACCTEQSEGSRPSGPAQSKVQLNPAFSAAPAIFVIDRTLHLDSAVATAPASPRAGPLDLPILLSTLLL